MRVIVCGDRNWTDRDAIRQRLSKLPKDATVIEGGQRGADLIARAVALELGLSFDEVRAQWTLYGRAAGPMRNVEMLSRNPDLVIAFHHNLALSKGTKNMVALARKIGVPVEVIT